MARGAKRPKYPSGVLGKSGTREREKSYNLPNFKNKFSQASRKVSWTTSRSFNLPSSRQRQNVCARAQRLHRGIVGSIIGAACIERESRDIPRCTVTVIRYVNNAMPLTPRARAR
ncbi:hypothetical protein DBV15_02431 [Temnothorax longispinosus]|uniref:Uncharacterized protein n=1 Tax=Temnothorax longispinosus TaxID=300112 RepID=A0A4S2KVU8_9HYME|nr:hypothetical protein DBV15_02431 [Temnothorax longispinosus]